MIAGLAFTVKGLSLLKKIMDFLAEDYLIFDKSQEVLSSWLSERFKDSQAIIFIGATGIAVRLIAPLLKNKTVDPAVLVLDEKGDFVIPLISSHLGGANKLGKKIAEFLSAHLVLTTATDVNKKFAADSWARDNNCVVVNPKNIKYISGAILAGEKVGFSSDFPILGSWPNDLTKTENSKLGICLSLDENKKPFELTLNLVPKIVFAGLGCRKNSSFEDLLDFLEKTLKEEKISLKALAGFSSIELKKEEACFLKLAETFKLPFSFFSAQKLNKVPGKFTSSEFVKKITGVDNVCERSAMLAGSGELILKKTTGNGFSLALLKKSCNFKFDD